MFYFKHAAIALASATSAVVTASLLLFMIKKHKVSISFGPLCRRLILILAPLVALSIWLVLCEFGIKPYLFESLKSNYHLGHANLSRISLVISILPGIIFYFISANVFHLPESEIITGRLLKRFKRK
jgi:putative peptidoglycan lipid II flippase